MRSLAVDHGERSIQGVFGDLITALLIRTRKESNRHRRLKSRSVWGGGRKHYYRVSALFPPSTGTDSVPFPAFLGGITAYGSYTKGGSIGGWGISKSVCTGLSWFNRIRAGVYGLHRTGPGRSAWTVSEDRQSVRFSLQRHKARPQGQQGIYTHLMSYHVPILGQTLDSPEQLRSCYSTWPREFCHCPL